MRVRRFLRRLAACLGVFVLALTGYLVVLVVTTPDVDHLREAAPAQTSYMRLRAEQRGHSGSDRVDWVDLDDISPYLVCAVVKAEDRGFFRHSGFEWAQIRKAFWANVTGGRRIGGSTITQQLARNLYLGPDRSLHRKLREALIARRLEGSLDKRRILELYLNVVEWGDGVWGAKQAARVYFGRSPAELDPIQATFLASLLPAPRAPLTGKNLVRARTEQRRVLHQMVVSKLIDHASPMRHLTLARVLANGCAIDEEIAATERARRMAAARSRVTPRAARSP